MTLRPISKQVMVITGATSGIGLATARMAARRGAKLVLAARSENALRELTAELASRGRESAFVVADVGNMDDVRNIARTAFDRFGRFDTWVNNAGVSAFAKLTELSEDDHRRIFETNYFGLVNGSLVAVEHLRQRGGALINVGSIVSEVPIPLQGAYSASKHAVRGFTTALRMELEKDGAPVVVTLVKPTSIATPFPKNAKNYMDFEATLPPPVYDPTVVAETILHCAEHPTREIVVGGGGKFFTLMGRHFPTLAEWYIGATTFRQQRSDRPRRSNREALHTPSNRLQEHGTPDRWAKPFSLYTKSAEHPLVTLGLLALASGAIAGLILGKRELHGRRTWGGRLDRVAHDWRERLGV